MSCWNKERKVKVLAFLRRRLLILVFAAMFVLNYNPQMLFNTHYQHWGWNFALLASILIILLMKLRDPRDWKEKLGLNFCRRDIWGFFIVTSILLVISFYLVDYVSGYSNVCFKPMLFYYKQYLSADYPFQIVLSNYLYYIPETFNEEMIIGALILFAIERKFKQLNQTTIAIGIALVFSLMHQALYAWSPVQPGILLTTSTLLTLFFVGVIRNILILKTRKIVYSWALHLSFNLVFFSGFFVKVTTNKMASEPEKFNIVFGNWLMLALTGTVAIMFIIWLNKDKIFSRSNSVNYFK